MSTIFQFLPQKLLYSTFLLFTMSILIIYSLIGNYSFMLDFQMYCIDVHIVFYYNSFNVFLIFAYASFLV